MQQFQVSFGLGKLWNAQNTIVKMFWKLIDNSLESHDYVTRTKMPQSLSFFKGKCKELNQQQDEHTILLLRDY